MNKCLIPEKINYYYTMKIYMKKLLFLFTLIVFFISCQQKINLVPSTISLEFYYDSLHLEKKVNAKLNDIDTNALSTVDIKYPVFKDSTLNWINNFIVEKIITSTTFDSVYATTINKFAADFLEHFSQESALGNMYAEWARDINYTAKYLNDSLLQLNFELYEFSGGAHSNTLFETQILNINSKKQLPITDLLNKDNDTLALKKIAIKELHKMKQIKPSQKLDDDAGMFINDATFYLSNNFWYDSANVYFFYNNYEVQCYADGPLEIAIPKTKLKRILKDKFLN